MRLADSHIHLFRNGHGVGPYGPAFVVADELAAYEALREKHQIDRALVVGYEGMSFFRGNNADLARLRRYHHWIAPLAFCNIHKPPMAEELRRFAEQRFVGISLYALTPEDADALCRWSTSLVEQLNALDFIVSINARPESIRRLFTFVDRLADCSVLFSHIGLPGAASGKVSRRTAMTRLSALLTLKSRKNVGVKISGMYAISSDRNYYRNADTYLKAVHETLGPRRLYWGSDFSPVLSFVSFSQAIDAVSGSGLPERDLRAIMHGNLMRLIAHAEGPSR
jgi:predicted TIM-barrel fold metal-dependent hydrolase